MRWDKDDFFGGDFDLNKDGVTDFYERELAWEILEKPFRDELAAQQKEEEAADLRREEEAEEVDALRREEERILYASCGIFDGDDIASDAGPDADVFADADFSGSGFFDF